MFYLSMTLFLPIGDTVIRFVSSHLLFPIVPPFSPPLLSDFFSYRTLYPPLPSHPLRFFFPPCPIFRSPLPLLPYTPPPPLLALSIASMLLSVFPLFLLLLLFFPPPSSTVLLSPSSLPLPYSSIRPILYHLLPPLPSPPVRRNTQSPSRSLCIALFLYILTSPSFFPGLTACRMVHS